MDADKKEVWKIIGFGGGTAKPYPYRLLEGWDLKDFDEYLECECGIRESVEKEVGNLVQVDEEIINTAPIIVFLNSKKSITGTLLKSLA